MAVANQAYNHFRQSTGGNSYTIAFDVGSGSDRLLLALSYAGGNTTNGVTYAGAALTQLSGSPVSDVSMWKKDTPATGSNNVVYSFSGYTQMYGTHTAWNGTNSTNSDSTDTMQTNTGGSGTAPNIGSVTCPGDGAIWAGSYSGYEGSNPSATSGTQLGYYRNTGSGNCVMSSYRTDTGTFGWSPNAGATWRVLAVPIKALASAAAATPRPVTILDAVHRASNW